MAKEIEKKFLVTSNEYKKLAFDKIYIYQGYPFDLGSTAPDGKLINFRVRIKTKDHKTTACLTLKKFNSTINRSEYEYTIPAKDAFEIAKQMCKYHVCKMRYKVRYGGLVWEVDEFLENNKGIVTADLELPDENYKFEKPSWIGKEITGSKKYSNLELSKN